MRDANHSDLLRLRGLSDRVINSAEDLKREIDEMITKRKLEEIEDGVLRGRSVRAIAKSLDLPRSTVFDHIKRLSR
jgi:DNA-binding NarL/FixJ family response regulator